MPGVEWNDSSEHSLSEKAHLSENAASEAAYSPPPAAGGRFVNVWLVLLSVGLIAATVWAIYEYRQGARMRATAQQAVALMAQAAPPQIQQELNSIQALIASRQTNEAAQRLAQIQRALSQGLPQGAEKEALAQMPIPESAYADLPQDAAQFFRAREELFRRFLLMCQKARELKAQGVNVDPLRQARDRVIEAARLGQEEHVRQNMGEMAQLLEQTATHTEKQRSVLRRKAERLKQALESARQQGRDLRAVMPLVQQAEQAAEAGQLQKAGDLIEQALAAVKRAPSGRRKEQNVTVMRPGLTLGGRRPNPLLPLVRMLLGVMGAEEKNLRVISQQLIGLSEALAHVTPPETSSESENGLSAETLKPLVDKAMTEMQTIAQRRQELSKEMQRKLPLAARRGASARGSSSPPDSRPSLGRQAIFAILANRLLPVLDRLRSMSAEDYQKQKGALVREIVRAVLEPPTREQLAAASAGQAQRWPADPAQRIRAKMLAASKTLLQWQIQGQDTSQIEKLFAQARQALYGGELVEAEKLVDEARVLLGLSDESARPPDEGLSSADMPLGNDTEINLRARPATP